MQLKQLSTLDGAEAVVLRQLVVRLVRPEEQDRWDQLVSGHHYLKTANLVGERLCYVVEYQGRWLALLGWSAAAYHIRARDQWVGWNSNQRRARLRLVANNARFCVLTEPGEYPNLATRALALNTARLSEDWLQVYGHPIVLVESFVDTQLFRGTAYQAAGWQALGYSSGFKRVAQDFYEAHDRPKQLYVRELIKHAARKLRQRHLPEALQGYEQTTELSCQVSKDQLSSLWHVLHRAVPESRKVNGLRHKQATVLTLTFAFLLSGGQGGHRAVASFARDLSPTQRAAVRCWFNRKTRTYDPPTENCIYRVLKAVPVLEFQQAIWAWQQVRHGGRDGQVVVLDGKALRGSQGTQLVGAINAQSGRTLGVQAVADKSNEIPAGQTLLERLELDGTIALMDALHTQVQTARSIVQEGGGDFVLFVKGNQAGLLKQAQHFLPEDFSPSTPPSRTRSRSDRMAGHQSHCTDARTDGLPLCRPVGTLGAHPPVEPWPAGS
jgi:predicted transposase YbfD/YdcC